jgi:hypothetical protein
MGIIWTCDICNAPGFIHPKTENITEIKTVTMEIPDPKDPVRKKVKRKVKQEIPKTQIIRRQNTQGQKVEKHAIPLTKDLEPRAIIVMLKAGMENIQKDFCVKCYEEKIKPEVDKLFDFLMQFQDK